jgi:alkanesulfonate monooxygenase SsuD/methylene tetrahydromethanopterin reductase-like flavin-dependent oxidoreductase (luciferase family)
MPAPSPSPPPQPATFGIWTELRPGAGRQPDPADYRERLEEAVLAEQLGFSAVWGSEHHAVEDGHLSQQLPFLAAVAARTERVRIGTGVLLLPLYRPREVAEQAAVVDLISGGRLILGFGGGWVEREFDAFGVDRRQRGRLLEEKVAWLRRAFAEGAAADGPDGSDLPVGPPPAQAGGPPIYLGGSAPAALDRVARIADGWFALAHFRWQRTAEQYPPLRAALEAAGRPAEGFPIVAGVHLRVSDDPERTWATELAPAIAYQLDRYGEWATDRGRPRPAPIEAARLKRSAVFCDTAEGVVAALREFQAQLPFTHVALWSRPAGISHEAACANLERVAREVAPAFAAPPPAPGSGSGREPAWR